MSSFCDSFAASIVVGNSAIETPRFFELNTDSGTWQVDEDLGDTSGGSDYGGSYFDNQKGTRLHIIRLH